MEKMFIGIDIGGTTIKMGFINQAGEIIHKWEIPTNKYNKGEGIADDIWLSIKNTLGEQHPDMEFSGVGVGAPGFVNRQTGIVEEAVNIGWKNYDLRDRIKKISRLPVVIENDANLAALAETWNHRSEHSDNVIFITLGTGVGGGIIVNGDIMHGANHTAAEIGHVLVDVNGYSCNCGRTGCLETIASATGMVRQAMDYIADHPDSALASFYMKHGELNAKDIFDLAREGDTPSENIINKTADVLGFVLANTAVITNPDKIIIGGGVSKAGKSFLSKIKRAFKKYALPRVSDGCDMTLAQLGNDAGMIGAAYLAKETLMKI